MSTRIVLVVYVLILVAAAGLFVVFWLIRLAFWCGWRFILVLLRLFVLLLLLFCCLQQFLNGLIQRILFGGGVKFLKSTFAFVAIWYKPVGFSDEEGKEEKAQQNMKWVSVMKQGYAECCVTWCRKFFLYDILLFVVVRLLFLYDNKYERACCKNTNEVSTVIIKCISIVCCHLHALMSTHVGWNGSCRFSHDWTMSATLGNSCFPFGVP